MGVQIQERDEKLLRLCFEHQFITIEHAEYAFKTISTREARKRICELEEAGYLRRHPSPIPDRKFFFRLSPAGQEIALRSNFVEYTQQRFINLNQFRHDSLITSVRQRLEGIWKFKFEPERSIKESSYRGKVPDGILTFPSRARVALEIEASDKGKRRFSELVERFDGLDISFVLYVSATNELGEILKAYIKAARWQQQPMGVVTWPELRVGYPRIWVPHPSGTCKLFDFRDPFHPLEDLRGKRT